MIELSITPVPKPRMTQSDRWKHRGCTDRYWEYKDKLRSLITSAELPDSYHVIFVIPMPRSWPLKKRQEMLNKPHKSRPDRDNYEKAFLDALFDDDSSVWDGRTTKVWGENPKIIILQIEPFDFASLSRG
jgi:Holliday junction resolvase RusA-like endonuclease